MAITKIPVAIREKIAIVKCGTQIVADNTNYAIVFTFDEEWDDQPVKTARFICGDWVVDRVFEGDTVQVPMLPPDYTYVQVGVYAGELSTSTPARINIVGSILGKAPSDQEAAEIARQEAELQRQRNELDRIAAETDRVAAEVGRVEAEEEREQLKQEMIDVINFAHDAATDATTAATEATEAAAAATTAAQAATEAAGSIDKRFADLIDPSLTESGKAADAKVVGERLAELEDVINLELGEIVVEEWVFDKSVPTADLTVHNGKTISSKYNIATNENYTCVSFVVAETGFYKITASTTSQLRYFLYDDVILSTAHYVRTLPNADVQTGIRLFAGDVVVANAFSKYLTISVQYSTEATIRLNPTLELTAAQDAQVRDFVNGELDDVLDDGYQRLRGEWARGGWKTFTQTDSRSFRVRYKDVVEFDRDVQIVMSPGFYALAYYEGGGSQAAMPVVIMPKGTRAHITVRRAKEDINEIADIDEFAAALSISTCIADIQRYSDTFADVSMFARMGVCGDSYAGGGGIISGIRPLTWGKNLERQAGILVDIYARSGQTVVGWMTDAKNGLPALLSGPECGLYWMQHGINGTSTEAELGTPDDMTADPRPATFYGQYAEAVKQIQATFPKARIVLATIVGSAYALYSTLYRNVNSAIKSIAEYCGVPVVDVVDDDFYKSRWYANSMRSNHPTAMEAGGIAEANRRLISRCIRANPDYFVGYGSSGYSITGPVLTENNYTDADKEKLAGIEDNADANVQADWAQTDDTADSYIKNKPVLPAQATDDTLGLVKLNPNEGVGVNDDGQLVVGVVLTSPNGTKYRLTVADDGTLTATEQPTTQD